MRHDHTLPLGECPVCRHEHAWLVRYRLEHETIITLPRELTELLAKL